MNIIIYRFRPGGRVTGAEVELGAVIVIKGGDADVTKAVVVVVEDTYGTDVGRGTKKKENGAIYFC